MSRGAAATHNHVLAQRYDREAQSWDGTLERLSIPVAYRRISSVSLSMGTKGAAEGGTPADRLTVLDAGIGTGAMSVALADTYREAIHVTGIDLSTRMLDRAALNLTARGVPHVLLQQDLLKLPFESGSFDIVVSTHTIEHVMDPFSALHELTRVLAERGTIVVIATRPGLAFAYLRMKWHIRCSSKARLAELLEAAGAEVRLVAGLSALPAAMSIAAIGTKRE